MAKFELTRNGLPIYRWNSLAELLFCGVAFLLLAGIVRDIFQMLFPEPVVDMTWSRIAFKAGFLAVFLLSYATIRRFNSRTARPTRRLR